MQWHGNLGAGKQMLPQLLHWGATNTFCSPIFTHWVSQFSSKLLGTCKLSVIVSLYYNRSAINSEVSVLNYIAGKDWQPIKYSILVYLANSDDCILSALDVQHYLCMFSVTCMLNLYSTNCGLAMLPKLYTTLRWHVHKPADLCIHKPTFCVLQKGHILYIHVMTNILLVLIVQFRTF